MDLFLEFLTIFFWSTYFMSPLLIVLAFVILILGQIAGRAEKWSRFDALYWSFVTATTVGYGDIRPTSKLVKMLSLLIAFAGLIFTGFLVAIAVNSASFVIEGNIGPEVIEKINSYKEQS